MTDLMQHLYEYAQEFLVMRNIDTIPYREEGQHANQFQKKLLQTLTEEQQTLFWDYDNAKLQSTSMESEALFLSAFQMARELY